MTGAFKACFAWGSLNMNVGYQPYLKAPRVHLNLNVKNRYRQQERGGTENKVMKRSIQHKSFVIPLSPTDIRGSGHGLVCPII